MESPRFEPSLTEQIEDELNLGLNEEIRTLLEGKKVENIKLLLDKIEAYLVESGVELTQDKKQAL